MSLCSNASEEDTWLFWVDKGALWCKAIQYDRNFKLFPKLKNQTNYYQIIVLKHSMFSATDLNLGPQLHVNTIHLDCLWSYQSLVVRGSILFLRMTLSIFIYLSYWGGVMGVWGGMPHGSMLYWKLMGPALAQSPMATGIRWNSCPTSYAISAWHLIAVLVQCFLALPC